MSMPQLQNLGLSGVAHCGVDIGGLFDDCHGELLARWAEFGIFQPFVRFHSEKPTHAQEPWSFGEPWETSAATCCACGCGCCPTSTGSSTRRPAPARRSCARCCSSIPADEATYAADDEFLAATRCSWRRSPAPASSTATSTCPRAHGCSGGPASASRARRTCSPTPRSGARRCTRAPTRRSRCGPSATTPAGEPGTLTLRIFAAPGAPDAERALFEDAGEGYGESARRSVRCAVAGAPPR